MSDGTTPLRQRKYPTSSTCRCSAAFCLGALQALDKAEILPQINYLSTVSGGGYIGSLSASMSANGGHFPFESYLSEDETPSLQHVCDYSNHLFPHSASDLLFNVSIYLRGLVANAILVLPLLLIAAAFTIASKPMAGQGSYPNILVSGFPTSSASTTSL